MRLGLRPEELAELLHLLRMVGRDVLRLREVVGQVVELDGLVIGIPARAELAQLLRIELPRDPLQPLGEQPAVLVHPAVAEDLVVLLRVALRRGRVRERVGEGDAVERLLLDAVDRVGHRDPGEVENRRADVVHVRVVAPNRARIVDAARPVHDHRVPRAAEMRGDLLAPVERGVAGPGPPGRVMRGELLVAPGLEAAVLEEEPHLLLGRERDPVQRRHLVERARERALHARAVVAPDPDHDGVVELAHLVDRVDDPADVPVGVLGVARVDLHLTGVEALVRLVERVPGRERVVARRQLRVGGNDAERLLPRERLLAHHVPPLVERAAVLVRPLARHVVRRVAAAGCDVGEPRRLRLLGADPVKPVDRLVGEVVLEVVLLAVLGLGDADDLLVLGDQRVVLPGLTAEEAPEVIEPEPGRPAVERPREPLLVVRGQMPLPEPSGQVAVLLEDARKRRAIVRDRSRCTPGRGPRTRPPCRSRPGGGCARSAAPPSSASRAP